MTIAIRMKGDITEITMPASFGEFVSELNLAGVQGKQYVIMPNSDGQPIALNTQNILTARGIGLDEEAEDFIG